MKNKVKDFNTLGNIVECLKNKVSVRMESLLIIIRDLNEKSINLNPSLQLNYEKQGKRSLYFWKYCRVSENLCLRKNRMLLRLQETINKDSLMNFKIKHLYLLKTKYMYGVGGGKK